MMNNSIAITTTSFANYDKLPLDLLENNGYKPIVNPYGRRVTSLEIIELADNAVGIIAGTEKLTKDIFLKLPHLKIISRCGTGIDNVDMDAAKEAGIKVFNTPDGPTLAVAELTLGLILNLLRKISFMDRQMRKSVWEKHMGNLLAGKKVGIIGFGRIGRRVAKLLSVFEVKGYFYDPYISENEFSGFVKSTLDQLLNKSDIMTLHLGYCQETCDLITEREFSQMKKGAILINCSRGGIVNEKDLYKALVEGSLSNAAIDVFDEEPYTGDLAKLDNVILTPHIGSYAQEARIKMEVDAVNNLLAGLGHII